MNKYPDKKPPVSVERAVVRHRIFENGHSVISG